MNKCKLTCGPYGALWPKPSVVALSPHVTYFHKEAIQHSLDCQGEVCDLLGEAVQVFKDNLDMYHPRYDPMTKSAPWTLEPLGKSPQIILVIEVFNKDTHFNLDIEENYSLTISKLEMEIQILLSASTFFGARNGLETLSQLIDYEEATESLMIVDTVSLTDTPTFHYRGIILDTSRNYFTVNDIERTIDAMAMTKLNTFHWHITDSHSFPMEMPSLPKMTYYGAYTKDKIYRPEEIKRLVEYGRIRGVRVMPEFDAPAHVGNGFQWGELDGLGKLTVCENRVSDYKFRYFI